MQNTYQPTSGSDYQQPAATTKTMSTVSFIFNGIGLLVFPLLFGAIAAGFAGTALSRDEGMAAKWAMGVSIANMLYGAVMVLIALSEIGAL